MIGDTFLVIFELFIGSGHYLFGLIVLWGAYRLWSKKSLLEHGSAFPKTLEKARQDLNDDRWAKRYQKELGRLMDWVTLWMGDQERFPLNHHQEVPLNIWQELTQNPPFTWQSYERCLVLAFIYPLLAFVMTWTISSIGSLGEQEIFKASVSSYLRTIYLTGLVMGICFAIWAINVRKASTFTLTVIAIGIGVIFSVSVFSIAGNFAFTIAMAVTIVILIALVRPIIFNNLGIFVGAMAFVIVWLFAFSGALFHFNEYSSSAWMSTISFIIPFVSLYVIKWIYWKAYKQSEIAVFWFIYNLLLVSCVLVVLFWNENLTAQLILLFLLLLPLFNAPLDWLSLGFTRLLLKHLQAEKGWWVILRWAVLDMLIALVFLLLISLVMVAVVSVANLFALKPIVDLTYIFNSLRNTCEHASDFWIYFILLSTLFPTLVHFAVVGGAITRMLPDTCRHKLLANMDHYEESRKLAWLHVSLMPVLGFVLMPALLLYTLFALLAVSGGWLGEHLLLMAEQVAYWIDPTLGSGRDDALAVVRQVAFGCFPVNAQY